VVRSRRALARRTQRLTEMTASGRIVRAIAGGDEGRQGKDRAGDARLRSGDRTAARIAP
jgi:hypothetical protein